MEFGVTNPYSDQNGGIEVYEPAGLELIGLTEEQVPAEFKQEDSGAYKYGVVQYLELLPESSCNPWSDEINDYRDAYDFMQFVVERFLYIPEEVREALGVEDLLEVKIIEAGIVLREHEQVLLKMQILKMQNRYLAAGIAGINISDEDIEISSFWKRMDAYKDSLAKLGLLSHPVISKYFDGESSTVTH